MLYYKCAKNTLQEKENWPRSKFMHVVRDNSNSNRDHTFINTHMHVIPRACCDTNLNKKIK